MKYGQQYIALELERDLLEKNFKDSTRELFELNLL
jgi:hypothetical protein